MQKGKHLKPRKSRRPVPQKAALLIVSAVMIITAVTGGTVAYYNEITGTVNNTFTAASGPDVEIQEAFSFGDTEKKNVTVKNTGDAAGYIRCAVTYVLQDDDGAIAAIIPEAETDYTVAYGDDWVLGEDGFWYYKSPVAPGASTTELIQSCKTNHSTLKLVVDISAQTVQATPADAVNEAWPANPLGLE